MALADVITARDADTILAGLLVRLKGKGFPVTAWQSGDVGRTLVEVEADVLAELDVTVGAIAAGGYRSTATGRWLTLLASEFFALERVGAAFAEGVVTLVDGAQTGPHTLQAGDLWVESTSGLRFSNIEAGTLKAGGALALKVRAEHPGASGNANTGTIARLVTSLPGVTASNHFGLVRRAGGGLGTVFLVPNGMPTASDDVVVEFTGAGGLGGAAFRWSATGGATWNESGVTVPAGGSYPLPGVGITLRFDTDAGVFGTGDKHTFSTTTWRTQEGRDEESNESLAGRCGDRWADLGPAATSERYANWAREASKDVTRVFVEEDATTPGQVNVIIAGADGGLPATVAVAQAYLDKRRPLTVTVEVASVEEISVLLTGTVYHLAVVSSTVQADVEAQLLKLQRAVAIGGDSMGAGARGLAQALIIDAITDAGGVLNVKLTSPVDDTTLTGYRVPNIDASGLVYVQD